MTPFEEYQRTPRRYLEGGERGHVIVAEGPGENPTIWHLLMDGRDEDGRPHMRVSRIVEACEDPGAPEAAERRLALAGLEELAPGTQNNDLICPSMDAVWAVWLGDEGVGGEPPRETRLGRWFKEEAERRLAEDLREAGEERRRREMGVPPLDGGEQREEPRRERKRKGPTWGISLIFGRR